MENFDRDLLINEWPKYIGTIDNQYINKKLKGEQSFFKDIYDVIQDNKEYIANYIIGCALKLELQELEKESFKFALVTGIGRTLKSGPVVEKGNLITLSTLSDKIKNLMSRGKVDIIPTPGKLQAYETESNCASLHFTIKIGSLQILDIVLRYKGVFTCPPTIFAMMTKEFKEFLCNH